MVITVNEAPQTSWTGADYFLECSYVYNSLECLKGYMCAFT